MQKYWGQRGISTSLSFFFEPVGFFMVYGFQKVITYHLQVWASELTKTRKPPPKMGGVVLLVSLQKRVCPPNPPSPPGMWSFWFPFKIGTLPSPPSNQIDGAPSVKARFAPRTRGILRRRSDFFAAVAGDLPVSSTGLVLWERRPWGVRVWEGGG